MEDLQIRDRSPLVLVETKGIIDLPSDEETLQVWKYLTPRIKELKRYDIRGLSIINHQKNLPPFQRENKTLFRDVILTNAIEHEVALLTTWDLFRLARGFKVNKWNHDSIKDLFYNSGRIEIVPSHYRYIGNIEHIWDKNGMIIIGTEIKDSTLKKGDHIAFELPVDFIEQIAESLEIDGKEVIIAEAGGKVGIKTVLNKEQTKKGIRIFKVVS